MIFSQYKETCKVLIDYPTIGEEYIFYYAEKPVKNLLHKNIDVRGRSLVSEFPGDGVKFISKLKYHCENTTFADKSRYCRLFIQVSHKGGESEMDYIKIFQYAQDL